MTDPTQDRALGALAAAVTLAIVVSCIVMCAANYEPGGITKEEHLGSAVEIGDRPHPAPDKEGN